MTALANLHGDYQQHRSACGLACLTLSTALPYTVHFLHWLEHREVTTPQQMNSDLLIAWRQEICSGRHHLTGLPLSPITINLCLLSIRTFLSWLGRRGFVPTSFAALMEPVRTHRRLPLPAMTHVEVRDMLRKISRDNAFDLTTATIVEFLYTTGVRPRELLKLDLADVQADRRTVKVLGKGGKERMVPIGRHARRTLDIYIAAVRPILVRNAAERALWIESHHGRRMTYAALAGRMRALRVRLGLPRDFTIYTLRRTCATELVRAGVSIWLVKQLLGHENLDSTNRYVALTAEDLKAMHARCHPRDRYVQERNIG